MKEAGTKHDFAKAYDYDDWRAWQGEGPAPAYWFAVNPRTGERTQIYRSYADYCWD